MADSGLVYCYVTDLLNVNIKGSGRIYYKGFSQLTQTIEGEGRVGNYY